MDLLLYKSRTHMLATSPHAAFHLNEASVLDAAGASNKSSVQGRDKISFRVPTRLSAASARLPSGVAQPNDGCPPPESLQRSGPSPDRLRVSGTQGAVLGSNARETQGTV